MLQDAWKNSHFFGWYSNSSVSSWTQIPSICIQISSLCWWQPEGKLYSGISGVQFKNDNIQRKMRGCVFLTFFLWMEETFFRSPPADFSLSILDKDWNTCPFVNQWLERDLCDWLRLVIREWRKYWRLNQCDHL